MSPRNCALVLLAALVAVPGAVRAAVAVYHFVPADSSGTMVAPATSAYAGNGQRLIWPGLMPEKCAPPPPRPTCVMTYRHPYTGQVVKVPLALPAGTPIVQHTWARVVYNYGSYTVSVVFLSDGSVDVMYNSGFFRPL